MFGLAGLDHLGAVLIDDGYRVIGPTVRDNAEGAGRTGLGGPAARLSVDTGPGYYRLRRRQDDAVFAHSAGPGSWKQFVHPPRRQLSSPARTVSSARHYPSRLATRFWACGATWPRAGSSAGCSGGGPQRDGSFERIRQGLFIVAVNCTDPGGCFCPSMGTGPAAGTGLRSRAHRADRRRVHRLTATELDTDGATASSHGFGVPYAVQLSRALNRQPGRLVLFGIGAHPIRVRDPWLSAAVAAAVPRRWPQMREPSSANG